MSSCNAADATLVRPGYFISPVTTISAEQGPDFDDMSSFFPCYIDDAIQYMNLGYGAQAPKIVIL